VPEVTPESVPQITREPDQFAPDDAINPGLSLAKPEPPAVQPPFTAPVPEPQLVNVPLGSALLLEGPTWWQHPGTGAWESAIADKLTVQVVAKEVSGTGDVMLICRTEGGNALWSVQEQQVLSGAIKLVRAAPVSPTLESEAARPADGQREIEKPDFDYFEEQRVEQEKREALEEERKEYGARLGRFTDANRRKLNAEKEFKQVRGEEYEKLVEYVKQYGEPSEPGKQDVQVVDFNYQARVTTKPGDSGIRRKTEIIVQWLLDHEMDECLTQNLNLVEWEKAKKDGRIPADLVREVEEPYKNADTFQFRTDPV